MFENVGWPTSDEVLTRGRPLERSNSNISMHTFSAAQSLSWMFGDQSPNSRRVCSLIRLRAGRATVWPCRCVGFTSLKIAPIISNLSVYVNALHGICNLVAQRCTYVVCCGRSQPLERSKCRQLQSVITDQSRSPDRAIGRVYVSLCVDNKFQKITLDLDIWHAGSRSGSDVKFQGHGGINRRRNFSGYAIHARYDFTRRYETKAN